MGNNRSPDTYHAQKDKYRIFIQQSRTGNSKENSATLPSFDLIEEFMAFLGICKFHKDLIETKMDMPGTRSNLGFTPLKGN